MILELSNSDLAECFKFLEAKEILLMGGMHSRLFKVSIIDRLWRNLYLHRWQFSNQKSGDLGRDAYIQRHLTERGLQEGRAGQYEVKSCRGHKDYLKRMKLCQGDLATASQDGTVQVYDCAVGGRRPKVQLDLSQPPTAMDYDGCHLVAAGEDGNIIFWSHSSPDQGQQTLGQHDQEVSCLVLNGKTLYSGDTRGDVIIWDLENLVQAHTFRAREFGKVDQMVVLPDEKFIVMTQTCLRVWSVEDEHLLGEVQMDAPPQFAVPFGGFQVQNEGMKCFVQRGHIFKVSPSGEVQEFEIPSKGTKDRLPEMMASRTWSWRNSYHRAQFNQWNMARQTRLTAVDCSEQHIVFGGMDGSITLFELSTLRQIYSVSAHQGPVNSVKVDAFKVLSAGADLCTKVWDLSQGNSLYTLLGGSIRMFQESPQHPFLQGCSLLDYDDTKIAVGMGSIARIYNFEIDR